MLWPAPVLFWLCCAAFAFLLELAAADAYSEHVIVHDVSPGWVAATYAAAVGGRLSRHQTVFPSAIANLFDTYPLGSVHLTLARGRWRKHWCAVSECHACAQGLEPAQGRHCTSDLLAQAHTSSCARALRSMASFRDTCLQRFCAQTQCAHTPVRHIRCRQTHRCSRPSHRGGMCCVQGRRHRTSAATRRSF